jgi:hypothetical protein
VSLEVSIEASPKKVFASAVDWPGWSRSGKTEALALDALVASGERYAVVTREAGLPFVPPGAGDVEVAEHVPGAAGTEFGVPSVVTDLDRRPVTAADAARLVTLVTAAWTVFERVVAGAPAELRKGPRGGGRDRAKIVAHVVEAEWYYSREIGLRIPQPDPTDRAAVAADRAAMLAVLGQASDGAPLAGRKWPARYAARRIAWHALDHAWEIADRSTPAQAPG